MVLGEFLRKVIFCFVLGRVKVFFFKLRLCIKKRIFFFEMKVFRITEVYKYGVYQYYQMLRVCCGLLQVSVFCYIWFVIVLGVGVRKGQFDDLYVCEVGESDMYLRICLKNKLDKILTQVSNLVGLKKEVWLYVFYGVGIFLLLQVICFWLEELCKFRSKIRSLEVC